MNAAITCAACQFPATIFVGNRCFCYFCARQVIFDMVRSEKKVSFTQVPKVGGMLVIGTRIWHGI